MALEHSSVRIPYHIRVLYRTTAISTSQSYHSMIMMILIKIMFKKENQTTTTTTTTTKAVSCSTTHKI